ncbi:MAG: DUF4365 domain-containing protein [Deltaproteobacteria bacterium]|nr:DUF4365 domain-containing protein [Deltaproteobacteria bacterium]
MTEKQRREELSRAYLHAVAAVCGFKVSSWSQDDDCLDMTIGTEGVLGGGTLASPKLDVQLKATSDQRRDQQEAVACNVTLDQYDKLVRQAATPKILVALMLPQDSTEWVAHSAQELAMRRCAYYVVTTGMSAANTDNNSITIHVPKSQPFSPDNLQTLMERLSCGEALT